MPFVRLHRRKPQPGAQGTDREHPQAGSCQTAKDDGGKPGVRFLARSKRGTRFRTASLLGGTRQRRRRICSPLVGRDQGRRHCRWRSPDDRNWLSFHDRYQKGSDQLLCDQPHSSRSTSRNESIMETMDYLYDKYLQASRFVPYNSGTFSPLDLPTRPERGYFSSVPPEPHTKRAIVFIDGQNLFHAALKAFGYTYPNFDPLKLSETLCKRYGWSLKSVRFYTGVPDIDDDESWHTFWAAKKLAMSRAGVYVFSHRSVIETRSSSCPMAPCTRSSSARRKASMCAWHWTSSASRTSVSTTWRSS